jgi:transposase
VEHLAIDLGGKESQICVRSSTGQIVEERRWSTASLGRYLATRPRSRVVVETCSEAFAVADAALARGHEVRVVPATLVRSLGVGARRLKTDRRDARMLSEVSCRIDLPSVHVPSGESRQRKTMCGMRDALVRDGYLNAGSLDRRSQPVAVSEARQIHCKL